MGRIVIVAGYQGTSYRREVTTLGRGGSDTTAVALAAALGAEACEIYSDVEGVYSADPRVVPSAKQLLELNHEEMLEMARTGARVLNEQAVEFARRAKIALYARKTHSATTAGTIVRPDGFQKRVQRAEEGQPSVAVSHVEAGLWIRATSSSDAVIEYLGERECAVCDWSPGARCAIFLGTDNLYDQNALSDELAGLGDDVQLEPRGLVSVIGQGIGGQTRWVKQGQDALDDADISSHFAHVTLSRLSWVVDRGAVGNAANTLHQAFITLETQPSTAVSSLGADT